MTEADKSVKMPQIPQMDAVLAINKPTGPTSAQCLTTLKRQGQKKIGHAGTLDPLASGVLLVLLGQATKLSSLLMENGRKIYCGKLRLGLETDTWDTQGAIIDEKPFSHIEPEQIAAEIQHWPTLTTQEVPAFSAAKFNGQPLYKLARKGQHTPVKIKSIAIYQADMLNISMPYVSFRVSCGSGAYIRSLAHSLGMRLGCGAALCELTREYSHPFYLQDACSWQDVANGAWQSFARPISDALPDWQRIDLDANWAAKVRNGVAPPASGTVRRALLYYNNAPLALACRKQDQWQIKRGLWNNQTTE